MGEFRLSVDVEDGLSIVADMELWRFGKEILCGTLSPNQRRKACNVIDAKTSINPYATLGSAAIEDFHVFSILP
jgi:hypothetical protein